MLVVCLLEPLWVSQRARPGANFFALIADNSQSLMVKDTGETQSRGELAAPEPERRRRAAGSRRWRKIFRCGVTRLTRSCRDVRDFSELNFDGRASALGNALKTAAEQWRGQPVAGVLLFTDGNATDFGDDLPPLDGCPPVYPVVLGQDTGLTDLSLNKVVVSQTAFEDAPVTIQADVAASGFAGSEIVTRLDGSRHRFVRHVHERDEPAGPASYGQFQPRGRSDATRRRETRRT